ncbi:hypothetical protein O1611_g7760 [Lasiodiplodia mahajangana]|uniref:Uncharacterized protein n=1 Tax=Lasiodiplodia mahajangana TaxID=1108764 RepID=A0ACC2JEZ8_9PEZI|nr:hypothetical protein O1611_g7760 [Lasiodiplodia mahajangana]
MPAVVNQQQPDFHVSVETITRFTATLNDFISALNTSIATINASITTINTSIVDLRTEMRDEMQGMQGLVEDLDFNTRARALNSTASRREAIIRPLRNTTTHKVVDLPQTLKEIKALRGAKLEGYLKALGQTPARGAEKKKI